MNATSTPKMQTYTVRGTSTIKAQLLNTRYAPVGDTFQVVLSVKDESDVEAIRHAQTIHLLVAE